MTLLNQWMIAVDTVPIWALYTILVLAGGLVMVVCEVRNLYILLQREREARIRGTKLK